jgi:hypothetical protein
MSEYPPEQQENEYLYTALLESQRDTECLTVELTAARTKLADAERRVERLREELQNIVNANPRLWGDLSDGFEPWAKNRARAALAETKEDQP